MKLLTGDITKIETDAIVNAASPDLRRSPGICDAIFAAADTRALTAACKKLRRCPVGTAVVTPSFGLTVSISSMWPWVSGWGTCELESG